MSNIAKPLFGLIYRIEPNYSSEVGRGGNGIVYDVKSIKIRKQHDNQVCIDPSKYVIKILYKDSDNKRTTRFEVNEIQFISEYGNNLVNIVNIIDYDESDEPKWYLMKKYHRFFVNTFHDLQTKLEKLLQIALAIQSLHNMPNKKAHRDIKPSNFLMDENGNLLLSDFGCAYTGFSDSLTSIGDSIGPKDNRPNEMINIKDPKKINYQKSDIYLFAKACWMVISENNVGFHGPYNRNSKNIYLKNNFNCETLEPIHEMLEKSLIEEPWDDRIDIETFIKYLKKQIDICNGNVSKDDLDKLKLKELLAVATSSGDVVSLKYDSGTKNADLFLEKLPPGTLIKMESKSEKVLIVFKSVIKIDEDIYNIKCDSNKSKFKSIVFCLEGFEKNIDKATISIIIKDSSKLDYKRDYFSMDEIILNKDWELIIDNSYSIL